MLLKPLDTDKVTTALKKTYVAFSSDSPVVTIFFSQKRLSGQKTFF